MEIQKEQKTIESYSVEIDGCKRTFSTQREAELAVERFEKVRKSRKQDFLIAEYIFDYQWYSIYNKNLLLRCRPNTFDEGGFVDGNKIDYDGEWAIYNNLYPPLFGNDEYFLELTAGLINKEFNIEIAQDLSGAIATITLVYCNGNRMVFEKSMHPDLSMNSVLRSLLKEAAVWAANYLRGNASSKHENY